MIFDLTSSTVHRKNGVKHIYTNDEIDYFACYNIDRDKIFLIDVNESPNTSIVIRYEKPKNNQIQGIKFEKDYLLENVLYAKTLHETTNNNTIK